LDYVTEPLVEDSHLWACTLFDELEVLGSGLSYQSLTRNIRKPGFAAGVCGVPNGHRARLSSIRRVMKPNGTGWNCPTHPNSVGGARPRTCWSNP